MSGMTKRNVLMGTVALAIGLVTNLNAQQDKPKANTASVAGRWTISVTTDQAPMAAAMTLAQDGAKVKGTFTNEHTGEVPLEGQFSGGTLTFAIVAHGGTEAAARFDFTGKMNDDGTLAGTLTGPMGEMRWTATRAK